METQSSKSQNILEFRRLQAVELFESGMKQVDIARVLGVTKGAVSQWIPYIARKVSMPFAKRVLLKNQIFLHLKDLGKGLRKAIRTFRSRPHLIQACLLNKYRLDDQ